MQNAEFVRSYFNAWNHGDPDGVADHLTADGVYRDIPENVQRSHDELKTSLHAFFSSYRHRYELIGEILGDGNNIAFQYRILADNENQGASPTGAYYGAEFMTLRGDAAMSITDYYDSPELADSDHRATPVPGAARRGKYAKSGLSDEQLDRYKQRLEQVMRADQLFRRPDLTLPRLARAVDCSVNHLSQVINAGFGMSFFDYLNLYRIELARELLTTKDDRAAAILDVAFAVGFSSNSAFYSAFKKRVNQTPAQFRRLQRDKAH
jgi:AraC-like DNA-binding protein/nuclear transport factor 2 (NTF2) superfamily protein